MTITDNTRCAGAQCSQRERCFRYINRSGSNQWASFDIERRLPQFQGPCVHRLWYDNGGKK